MNRGILVAFEGIDGTGKTTQIALLARHLKEKNIEVVQTREPTDGTYGRKIRALYTCRHTVTPEEELELFIADRREHVRELILPALERGAVVLTDRYYYSTAAYQGADGADPDSILRRNSFAPEPDLVILLTMDVEESMRRIREGRGESLNDFEQKEQLEKTASLFARFSDECIVRIDAHRGVNEVQQEIRSIFEQMFVDGVTA